LGEAGTGAYNSGSQGNALTLSYEDPASTKALKRRPPHDEKDNLPADPAVQKQQLRKTGITK